VQNITTDKAKRQSKTGAFATTITKTTHMRQHSIINTTTYSET